MNDYFVSCELLSGKVDLSELGVVPASHLLVSSDWNCSAPLWARLSLPVARGTVSVANFSSQLRPGR